MAKWVYEHYANTRNKATVKLDALSEVVYERSANARGEASVELVLL